MRLIDADELCADLRAQWEQVFSKARTKVHPEDFFIERLSAFHAAAVASDIDTFVDYVSSRPTVDAVIAVRCKDCKSCRDLNRKDRNEEAYADGVLWCSNWLEGVWPDDFCSYGKRREIDGGEDNATD